MTSPKRSCPPTGHETGPPGVADEVLPTHIPNVISPTLARSLLLGSRGGSETKETNETHSALHLSFGRPSDG